MTSANNPGHRRRTAVSVAGRLLVAVLVIETSWCALRFDLGGIVGTLTGIVAVAVVTEHPPS